MIGTAEGAAHTRWSTFGGAALKVAGTASLVVLAGCTAGVRPGPSQPATTTAATNLSSTEPCSATSVSAGELSSARRPFLTKVLLIDYGQGPPKKLSETSPDRPADVTLSTDRSVNTARVLELASFEVPGLGTTAGPPVDENLVATSSMAERALGFSGAFRVDVHFVISRADKSTIAGTVHSWIRETAGLVACTGQNPPAESLAAFALPYCETLAVEDTGTAG